MSRHWPLFDIVIRTPRLELRLPTEELLDDMIDVILDGVHDPVYMPFGMPWTDAPRAELPYRSLQHHWQQLASFSVESWTLNFAVIVDGKVLGTQGISGREFPRRREVGTGSWIGRRYQGQGIGTEMRAAVLDFAFVWLGADFANSGAWVDNAPSRSVSRKLGYQDNGVHRLIRRDEVVEEVALRLSRDDWLAHRTVDVDVTGFERIRPQFGLAHQVGD